MWFDGYAGQVPLVVYGIVHLIIYLLKHHVDIRILAIDMGYFHDGLIVFASCTWTFHPTV